MDILKNIEDSSSYSDDGDGIQTSKDIIGELENINFELSGIAADYVKKNPDKVASVMIINAFFKNEMMIPRLDELLGLLRGKAATFGLTTTLVSYSSKIKRSAEGSSAPDFSREDINGKNFRLSSLRGKYVVLHFVSSTCEMCEAQRPDVIKLYERLRKEIKNIEFVTVVINTEEVPISKEIKNSVKWVLIPENGGWSSELLNTFNVHALPFYMIINPNGTILNRDIPLFSIEETLNEKTGKDKKI